MNTPNTNRKRSGRHSWCKSWSIVTFGALSFAAISARADTTLDIVLTQPWTETGITLSVGEPFSVKASGNMNWFTGGCPAEAACDTTPDGSPWSVCETYGNFSAAGLPCWSLVGKVGPDGVPFKVGSSAALTSSADGELYLGVNDNNFPDNTGSWIAEIGTCTPEDTQMVFDPHDPGYHRYPETDDIIQTALCETVDRSCSMTSVFDLLTTDSQFVAPTDDTTPVTNYKMTLVNLYPEPTVPMGFKNSPICSVVSAADFSVTNYTMPGHLLHPGKVVRTIKEVAGKIVVETSGEGTGPYARLNGFLAQNLWRHVDVTFRTAVIRMIFHMHHS